METRTAVWIGLIVVLLAVIAGLIGGSFHKLEQNEVAFDYSDPAKHVDFSTLWSAGVHFTGLGHEFIVFPTKDREVSNEGSRAVRARTLDGLSIIIESSFTYSLTIEKQALGALFMQYGQGYADVYREVARRVIRDVASNYTAFQFWKQRDIITNDIFGQLTEELNELHARVGVFSLKDFSLPPQFVSAIVATDVALQEIQQVQFELAKAQVQSQTIRAKAVEDAKIIGLQANATARGITLDVEAQAEKIRVIVEAEKSAYGVLKSELDLSQDELTSWVWLDTLRSSSAEKLLHVSAPANLQL